MSELRCPSCGAAVEGRFCTRCGASLAGSVAHCESCGSRVEPTDRFCGECGQPTGRERRPATARLPWTLSAIVLVLFSIGIALFLQRWTSPRAPGGTITGGIPSPAGGEGEGSVEPGASGMPSIMDLASMSPREAADRLFDRAMAERESDNPDRARFFAEMGLQAYGQVPPTELDEDAFFHVGLLHLATGEIQGARAMAELLLAANSNHLFGLVLSTRAAEATGDSSAAASFRARLEAAIAAGEAPEEPPYAPHAALIRLEAAANGG